MSKTAAEFAGRVVLVTGAASGIGRTSSLLFAERGAAAVALVDRNEEALSRTAEDITREGVRTISIVADLANRKQCREIVPRVIEETGRLDAVVNNAAIDRRPIRFVDYDVDDFAEDLAINLTSGVVIAQEAAKHFMQADMPGSIVFVASINALGAGAGSAGYCASKAGMLGVMRVAAAELGSHQIRVNAVSPGPTDTARSTRRVGEQRMRQLRQSFEGAPLRRLASPQDIAEGIVYLCSDRARYITGHNLVVDGGLTASVYSTPQQDARGQEDPNAVD